MMFNFGRKKTIVNQLLSIESDYFPDLTTTNSIITSGRLLTRESSKSLTSQPVFDPCYKPKEGDGFSLLDYPLSEIFNNPKCGACRPTVLATFSFSDGKLRLINDHVAESKQRSQDILNHALEGMDPSLKHLFNKASGKEE